MSLVSRTQPTRYDHPHEPGEWVELRPARYETVAEKRPEDGDNPLPGVYRWLQESIVAWSYDAELTPENVRDLDFRTVNWLQDLLVGMAGLDPKPQTSSTPTISTPANGAGPLSTPQTSARS